MKLSSALGLIKGGEKTASAAAPASAPASTPSPSSDAGARLKQALQEAIAPEPQAKTASQASPVEDLTKIAADLSAAEHEAIKKEAQLYGASLCDGFMARAAQYKEAAARVAPTPVAKTAALAAVADEGFEKFAAENPELVKEAAELGFATTMGQLEKLADAAYAKGWNTTVEQIHKAACDCFVAGFRDTLQLTEGTTR
jgi:hypothetical protein